MQTDSLGRVFANGPGDLVSIPGHVIPKTLKMVLDTSLLNTQQYKVRIKGKVEKPWERSSTRIFVAASNQTRLDTRSKARRPIKVGIKGRGGRERAETRTLLVNAAHRLT